MRQSASKNTYEKTTVRFVIFREQDTWYGVALEFNIVESGDDPLEVMSSLEKAAIRYFNVAKKNKLDIDVLNQSADPEYDEKWQRANSRQFVENIFTSGLLQPAMVA